MHIFVVISSPHTAYCSQCRGIADGKRLVKYSRKRTNNGNRQVCVVVWGLYCVMHSVSALFLSLFLSFLWFQFIHSFYTFFVCFSFSFFLFFFNLLFLPIFHSPIVVFMFIYLFLIWTSHSGKSSFLSPSMSQKGPEVGLGMLDFVEDLSYGVVSH